MSTFLFPRFQRSILLLSAAALILAGALVLARSINAQEPPADEPPTATTSDPAPVVTPAIGELIIEELILQLPEQSEPETEPDLLTTLSVEGVAGRNAVYDGAVGRFSISVLRESILSAVNDGNVAVRAVSDAIAEQCLDTEFTEPDESDTPTCISPLGLQTASIRIYEEFDWTEAGRVSNGFRYENQLNIAILGTDFAGGLVDLVVNAGGELVRFDGLDFTVSGRGEIERQVMLDAIDDARLTARRIAGHMSYEIVRIVELQPGRLQSVSSSELERAEVTMADEGFEPTPVFGGSEQITSRVTMVFELRPLESDEE